MKETKQQIEAQAEKLKALRAQIHQKVKVVKNIEIKLTDKSNNKE